MNGRSPVDARPLAFCLVEEEYVQGSVMRSHSVFAVIDDTYVQKHGHGLKFIITLIKQS